MQCQGGAQQEEGQRQQARLGQSSCSSHSHSSSRSAWGAAAVPVKLPPRRV